MRSNDPAVRQFVEGGAEGPLTVESELGAHHVLWEAR